MRVDGAATDAIEALQLARSAEIIPLDVEIKRAKWNDERDERGNGCRDDDQGKASCTSQSHGSTSWTHDR